MFGDGHAAENIIDIVSNSVLEFGQNYDRMAVPVTAQIVSIWFWRLHTFGRRLAARSNGLCGILDESACVAAIDERRRFVEIEICELE